VVGAVFAGALFLAGLAAESYWALAIPVAAAFLFVLSLVVWIGWTIATVQTEASGDLLPPAGGPGSATATSGADSGTQGDSNTPTASAQSASGQRAGSTPPESGPEAAAATDSPPAGTDAPDLDERPGHIAGQSGNDGPSASRA